MKPASIIKSVLVQKEGTVATVSLNRPEVLNALNKEMLVELNKELKALSLDEEITIIILKGNGNGFCSGGDIKSMFNLGSEKLRQLSRSDKHRGVLIGRVLLSKDYEAPHRVERSL